MHENRSIRPLTWQIRLSLVAMAVSLVACAVTADDIDTWTGTVRGPGKILAVLMADKYSDELRVHAGLALIDMERADVDGISELQGALRQLDEEIRRRIVDGMAPELLRMLSDEGGEAGATGAPTSLQVRAKDASFLVLQYASPEQRAQLTDAVVGFFVEDFNGRSLAGNFSAEQVVRQLGAPAATRLVDAMSARAPQLALVKAAELIAAIGDPETKARAAARLVEIEAEMNSDGFESWIAERIRTQLGAGGAAVDAARVQAAVTLNQDQFIVQGAIPAMHFLADHEVVSNRLLAIATNASSSEDKRVQALMAMEGHVRTDQTQPLLALALSSDSPLRVRDYAFDRIADSRSQEAIPQLWPLATSAESANDAWRIRWRVGSLILTLGGPEIVQQWFSRLPSGRDVRYAREELYGYAERLAAMRPAPTEIVAAQLGSSDWWDRAIALYYYERVGTEADLARVQALSSDSAATQGEHWGEHSTISAIVPDVVAAIRARIGTSGAGGGTAPGSGS